MPARRGSYFARGRGRQPARSRCHAADRGGDLDHLADRAFTRPTASRSSSCSGSTSRPSRRASTGGCGRVTLLHGDLIHLAFNMYALWLAGPIVERWYGRARFLAFYLACAAGGSVASFVFGGDVPAVGASGAIFGLFGVLLAAGRLHHPVDRQSRALVGQLGMLILINLAFGFASGGSIDNAAHLGGLVAGLWLGALIVPTGVPTLSSLWHRPATATAAATAGRRRSPAYMSVVGIGVVAIVVAAGDRDRNRRPTFRGRGSPRPGGVLSAAHDRAQRAGGILGKHDADPRPARGDVLRMRRAAMRRGELADDGQTRGHCQCPHEPGRLGRTARRHEPRRPAGSPGRRRSRRGPRSSETPDAAGPEEARAGPGPADSQT